LAVAGGWDAGVAWVLVVATRMGVHGASLLSGSVGRVITWGFAACVRDAPALPGP